MSRLDARSWPASWPLLILLSKPEIEAGSGFEGARPGGHIGKLAICAIWPPGWNPALRAGLSTAGWQLLTVASRM